MKHLVFLLIMLAASITTHAQDKIYMRNGSVVEGKVKAVNVQTVTYRRTGADGPDYSVNKRDVIRIEYQNGVTEILVADRAKGPHGPRKAWNDDKEKSSEYGNNIFSIMPAIYTVDLNGTMSDPGFGISYERLLDEHGHIGFTLPVVIGLLTDRDFQNQNYLYSPVPSRPTVSAAGYTSFSIMPGIKFYPAPKSAALRYALGISFFSMLGRQPMYVYDYNSTSAADHNYSVYGFMIGNSINISATKHFYMAVDVNGGIPIADNRRAQRNDLDIFLSPMVQFMLKVGYRF